MVNAVAGSEEQLGQWENGIFKPSHHAEGSDT